MHDTAFECCKRFASKYPIGHKILDVGSYDVNGTLKPIFAEHDYVGVDMAEGPNVNLVVNAHSLPFADNEFDTSVSSSCFEHDPMFWVTFKEMARVTRKFIYINVPSTGGYHGYPGDCWRFLKDAMPALADWAGVELVETYIESGHPWNDNVGIFRCHSG